MHILLWVIQGFLCIMFLSAGLLKVSAERDVLRARVGGWVDDFNMSQIRAIGALEALGALGLVLPMMLDAFPLLTPWAAIGLGVTMIGAAMTHMKRSEIRMVIVNLFLLVLCGVVAAGRIMYDLGM